MTGPEPHRLEPRILTDAQLDALVAGLAARVDRLAGDLEAALDEQERRDGGARVDLTPAANAYLLDRRRDRLEHPETPRVLS